MNTGRDILTAFVAAFDRHDPDGFAALHAPGAAICWPDTRRKCRRDPLRHRED
jgi:hypothetical protein